MAKVQFPFPFEHKHPKIQNINEIFDEQLTFGQRAADWIATRVGSWRFIIGQLILLTIWLILNVTAFIYHWDPYPFILMNLLLSLQAAFTAPLIMMSQNRQAAKDRLEAHNDYQINQLAEEEIRAILNHLAAQDLALQEIRKFLIDEKGKEASS
jgi:uncharacterized membrane protein